MTRRIPRPDPGILALSGLLADMQRRLRDVETASQAGFTSVEGRSLDFYDPVTDEKLGSIGLQPDGTFGFERTGGAKPEAPTEPDVQPIPGGAIVAWDGRFEDTQSMLEIDRIAVHMDETAGFTVTRDTEVAAIYSHTGGTAVIPIDDGTEWYVKLVAVTKGQVWSDPSVEVHVAAVDAGVAFYQDEFTLTVDGAQDLALTFEPLSFSEHLYWHPAGGAGIYQREDAAWTRLGNTLSLIDDAGLLKTGDVISVEYAYQENIGLWIPFGHAWRYKFNLGSDTSYAAAAFDDSSWPLGPSPFGRGDIAWPGTTPANPPPATATPTNAPMNAWMRTTGTTTGGVLTFSAPRVDDTIDVYVDGTLVWHQAFTADPVEHTASVPAGDHVFAIYGYGQGGTTANTGEYFGVTIREDV